MRITPEPLKLLPNSNDEGDDNDVQLKTTISSWQAQDLATLKASDNAIIEIQPELSLFGSLNHLDVSASTSS